MLMDPHPRQQHGGLQHEIHSILYVVIFRHKVLSNLCLGIEPWEAPMMSAFEVFTYIEIEPRQGYLAY